MIAMNRMCGLVMVVLFNFIFFLKNISKLCFVFNVQSLEFYPMYTFMIIEGKSTILKFLASKSHCPTIRRKELISSHAVFL